MAAYCNNCKRYVNQSCDCCGGAMGITTCEVFGCTGSVFCPLCGQSNLSLRKQDVSIEKVVIKEEDTFEKKMARKYGHTSSGAFSMDLSSSSGDDTVSDEKKKGWVGLIEDVQAREENPTRTEFRNSCPACKFPVEPTWKYCPECGLRFSTLELPKN